jgi:molybdopterin synthase sulfur carrier subunit
MAIDMLYFAWVRESVGTGSERVAPPSEVSTVADLIDWLAGRSEGHARAFAVGGRVGAAVAEVLLADDAQLGDAREVALFPPVTGG